MQCLRVPCYVIHILLNDSVMFILMFAHVTLLSYVGPDIVS